MEKILLDVICCLDGTYKSTVLSIFNTESTYRERIGEKAEIHSFDKYRKKFQLPLIRSLYSRMLDNELFQSLLLKIYLRRNRYDLIVAFSDGISGRISSSIKNTGKNSIGWIHTDYLSESNDSLSYARLKSEHRERLMNYDCTLFVSKTLERKFRKELGLCNTTVLNNPIDIDNIRRLSMCDCDYIADKGKTNICYLGRLSHEKGIDRLLRAISLLPDEKRERLSLTVVGEGGLRDSVEALISNYGIQANVNLLGFMSNPYPVLRQMDCLIIPSRYEGFGLVALESLALGVPVISTDTVGAKEILRPEEGFGEIIDNSDEAIFEALHAITEDRAKLDKLRGFDTKLLYKYDIGLFKENLKSHISQYV